MSRSPIEEGTVELPTELKRDAFDAMCRAWSYCPSGLPHLDRMRWMGEYIASALSRASRVGAQGGEPTLSKLDELARVYASSYASPHHIVFTVEGLRNLLAASPTAAGPMTEEQIIELHKQHMTAHVGWMAFARAIEAAHGITSVGSVSTEGEVR